MSTPAATSLVDPEPFAIRARVAVGGDGPDTITLVLLDYATACIRAVADRAPREGGEARPNEIDRLEAELTAAHGKLAWLEESVRNAGCEIDYSVESRGERAEDCVWNRRAEELDAHRPQPAGSTDTFVRDEDGEIIDSRDVGSLYRGAPPSAAPSDAVDLPKPCAVYTGESNEAIAPGEPIYSAAQMRAALNSRPVVESAPEGFVPVPREPTEAMLAAHEVAWFSADGDARRAWAMMLAAAPNCAPEGCAHEWVSGDNEYVSNASVCLKCREIRPTSMLAAAPTKEKDDGL